MMQVSGSNNDSAGPVDANRDSAGDWRAETIDTVRRLIRTAGPDVVEDVKWRKPSNGMHGVPVWSWQGGIICTGETYKDKVKLTFANGAALSDPDRLFNASMDGNTRRAIDIHAGEKLDARTFKALVRAAVQCYDAAAKHKKAARHAGLSA